jgi:hypothetical protein
MSVAMKLDQIYATAIPMRDREYEKLKMRSAIKAEVCSWNERCLEWPKHRILSHSQIVIPYAEEDELTQLSQNKFVGITLCITRIDTHRYYVRINPSHSPWTTYLYGLGSTSQTLQRLPCVK